MSLAAPDAPPGHEARVHAAMTDPRTYAERPARVDVIETHCSTVFLAGARAYKVKKPVVLSFLDYGTAARRSALCREEVRLNRRLAPTIYLGTVALVQRGDGYALVADDGGARDETIEIAVEMRRFADADTLAARISAGAATPADAARIGHLLAGFHLTARRSRDVTAATAAVRVATEATVRDLEAAAAPDAIAAGGARQLGRFLDAALARFAPEVAARAARGLLRDGHGDLRAEHVILSDPPEIVDCIEFDPALRVADVAVDLSFLVMDLEALGVGAFARRILDAYRDAGGDPGGDALLATLACFRALVRAKVAAVRAVQPGADTERCAGERAGLMRLAERFAWRARGPLVLVCCGPAASGKSTLAVRLAAQSGLPHLSSDVVRKELAGLAPTTRAPRSAYSPSMTEATYRGLGERAARAVAESGGAIVDATFGTTAARRAFAGALGEPGVPVLFAECRAPAHVLERRAAERARRPGHVSDATAAVVRRQLAAWERLDEVPPRRRLVVAADRSPEAVADAVLAWLDRRLESGRGA